MLKVIENSAPEESKPYIPPEEYLNRAREILFPGSMDPAAAFLKEAREELFSEERDAALVLRRGKFREKTEELLSVLEPREAVILRLRFGLYDGRYRALDEIGEELSLTRDEVRHIEGIALQKLHRPGGLAIINKEWI